MCAKTEKITCQNVDGYPGLYFLECTVSNVKISQNTLLVRVVKNKSLIKNPVYHSSSYPQISRIRSKLIFLIKIIKDSNISYRKLFKFGSYFQQSENFVEKMDSVLQMCASTEEQS